MITVCQCNIFDGGRWNSRKPGSVTYRTARRFSQFVSSVNSSEAYPPISLIGVQEMSEADGLAIQGFLGADTKVGWENQRVPQGINGRSGIGFFWRPDLIETHPEWKLGETEVERLDNGYCVKLAGRLFRDLTDGAMYAFFTGKFAWEGATVNGHPVTEEDRRVETLRFSQWARQSMAEAREMAGCEAITAVAATDLNTGVTKPAWCEMNRVFHDPSRIPTFNSFVRSTLMNVIGQRFDYLWLERAPGIAFLDGPRRSPHFGSDHRAVYGTIGRRESRESSESRLVCCK